jgi:hypothetical protein
MKCGEKRMNTDDELSAKWWSEMWLIRRREHQQIRTINIRDELIVLASEICD